MRQPTVKPSDLVVALQLALTPGAIFKELSSATLISAGECHNAVKRLTIAGLMLPDSRRTATEMLHHFLIHGVPIVFPAVTGPSAPGAPTAHSAAPFRGLVASESLLVWPHEDWSTRGTSITPLYPGAAAMARRNQPLYDLLAITDALRVGSVRVRAIAADLLAKRLQPSG